MHHCHLKAASPPVGQREGQVHEGIKLDGVVLTVLHGANESGLVQALHLQRCQLCWAFAALPAADDGTPNPYTSIATCMKNLCSSIKMMSLRALGQGHLMK